MATRPAADGSRTRTETLERATLERRRDAFKRTTPGERLEQALELSRLAQELRQGFLRLNR